VGAPKVKLLPSGNPMLARVPPPPPGTPPAVEFQGSGFRFQGLGFRVWGSSVYFLVFSAWGLPCKNSGDWWRWSLRGLEKNGMYRILSGYLRLRLRVEG